MPTVVVPFRGETAKQRLAPAPEDVRAALAQAMFEDVLAAAGAVGDVVVAGGAGGQGPAVEAELRRIDQGPVLIVNADLPCARPRDLLTLLGALPERGLALVAAADGTTNALALTAPHLFAPLYGPGSAERFLARAGRLEVPAAVAAIPNLAEDVDTLADLERLEGRLGSHTAATLRVLGSRARFLSASVS
jgi:2-phospho-L-lactate guanylyltransferase (CobY/MobA/RfbA family)